MAEVIVANEPVDAAPSSPVTYGGVHYDALLGGRQSGLPLTEWSPSATDLLAHHSYTLPKVYTSEVTPGPGSFLDFRKEQRRDRAYETMAARLRANLGNIATYGAYVETHANEQSGLSREDAIFCKLVGVLATPKSVHGEGLHAVSDSNDRSRFGRFVHEKVLRSRPAQPVIRAASVTYEVATAAQAEELSDTLQAILQRDAFRTITPRTLPLPGKGKGDSKHLRHVVEVSDMLETEPRVVGGVMEKMKSDFDARRGRRLPGGVKETLPLILEQGHTFPDEELNRLQLANSVYRELGLKGTYVGFDKKVEARKYPNMIVRDVVGLFAATRGLFEGGIKAARGSTTTNEPQARDKTQRLWFEKDVVLEKDSSNQQSITTENRPPTTKAAGIRKHAAHNVEHIFAEQKKWHATVEIASMAIGGVLDFGIGLSRHVFTARRYVKEYRADVKAWKTQKEQEYRDADRTALIAYAVGQAMRRDGSAHHKRSDI